MSNSTDPDQAQHFVIPDLGPNYLQKLSADDTIRQRVKAAQIGLHAYVDILKTYFSHEMTQYQYPSA